MFKNNNGNNTNYQEGLAVLQQAHKYYSSEIDRLQKLGYNDTSSMSGYKAELAKINKAISDPGSISFFKALHDCEDEMDKIENSKKEKQKDIQNGVDYYESDMYPSHLDQNDVNPLGNNMLGENVDGNEI